MPRLTAVVWILLAWMTISPVKAQQPFIIDGTDVTAKGKDHLELTISTNYSSHRSR